jgi:hypothetical protein
MRLQDFNRFAHLPADSVYRVGADGRSPRARSPMLVRALAAIVAIGLPLMQVAPAASGDVLEIPQAVATPSPAAVHPRRAHSHHRRATVSDDRPSSNADWTAVTPPDAPDATAGNYPAPPPDKVAANSESYPPDPNVGSINDYQNQPGENGQPPSFAIGSGGGGGGRSEPQGSMTANLIIGGILVGLMAVEIASSHHHR